jgi:hypothetical protein
MRSWPVSGSGDIPSPELVAAWAALDTLAADRVPLWAAHWLVEGYDGKVLRTLAGLSGCDQHDVREILHAALAECGVTIPESPSRAANVVFTALADLYFAHRATERWIAERVYRIVVLSEYDGDITDLPLGRVYLLDAEWGQGWGRTDEQLAAEVRIACRAQLDTTN